MLKLASLALGLLTIAAVAPSSQAATLQNRPALERANGDIAQVFVRIGSRVVVSTPFITVGTPLIYGVPNRYEIERRRDDDRREHREHYDRQERHEGHRR